MQDECVSVGLDRLFADPKAFDGEHICTSGYFHDGGSRVLHRERNPTSEEYYANALILDCSECDFWGMLDDIRINSFVTVRGEVSMMDECWTRDEKGRMGKCVPFSRPIFLSLAEVPNLSESSALAPEPSNQRD